MTSRLRETAWIENLFRPLVVGAMVACVAVALADLARLFFPPWLFPAWKSLYIIVVCVLAALEAAYSYRLVQTRSISGNDLLRFRVIELALFVVVLKITAYLGHNWVEITDDLQIWTRTTCTPLDLETGVMFFFAFLAWGATTETLSDLDRLDGDARLRAFDERLGEIVAGESEGREVDALLCVLQDGQNVFGCSPAG